MWMRGVCDGGKNGNKIRNKFVFLEMEVRLGNLDILMSDFYD